MESLRGYRTYITLAVTFLFSIYAVWSGMDLGGEAFLTTEAALIGLVTLFLRAGVKESGPTE